MYATMNETGKPIRVLFLNKLGECFCSNILGDYSIIRTLITLLGYKRKTPNIFQINAWGLLIL